jgi:hypothetical protein
MLWLKVTLPVPMQQSANNMQRSLQTQQKCHVQGMMRQRQYQPAHLVSCKCTYTALTLMLLSTAKVGQRIGIM